MMGKKKSAFDGISGKWLNPGTLSRNFHKIPKSFGNQKTTI